MAEETGDDAQRDAELLRRIAKSDREAFAALMRRHGQRVRGLALSFSGSASEADDIVQDVFLMLWRRPDAWKPGKAAFSTWLYRVVANRCLDLARRQRVRRWLPFGGGIDPAADVPDAFERVAGKEKLQKVMQMIARLPEKQRLALLLSTQAGRSNAEIGEILGLSEGAAEQLRVRARRTLRNWVGELEGRE